MAAFLLIDGHAAHHIGALRDELSDAGLSIVRQGRIELTRPQAEALLSTETAGHGDCDGSCGDAARVHRVRPEEALSITMDPPVALFVTRPLPPDVDADTDRAALVEEVRDRCGPVTASDWERVPTCWRARFRVLVNDKAKDGTTETDKGGVAPATAATTRSIHCAVDVAHADAFSAAFERLQAVAAALAASAAPEKRVKSPWVSLLGLNRFLFPPGQEHPRSTGRLIVFGLYGPLDDDGRLTAGVRGSHVASDGEVRAMVDEIETEDILEIYVRDKGMSPEERRDVLAAADNAKKSLPNLSREQVDALFATLPRDPEGKVSFHELQRVILRARRSRLAAMKQMYPSLTSAATGEEVPPGEGAIQPPPPVFGRRAAARRLEKTLGAGALERGRGRGRGSTGFDPRRKIGDSETFDVVHKLLNRESHHICNIVDGNDPALTQNVRLLRDAPPPEEDTWDSCCCVRGTLPGSRVAKR